MYNTLMRDLPPKPIRPYSQQHIINAAFGYKRQMIRRAFEEYNERGWQDSYTKIKAFIKFEKAADRYDDPLEFKTPRLIQHRDPAYCYTLAQYLSPVSDQVFSKRWGGKTRLPWFTKGLDTWGVGERIAAMRRKGDVFILLDHSRYDSTLRAELRQMVEYRYYKQWFKNDQWLSYMLDQQINNKGTTKSGIKYEVHGTMMSGEYNTSLGDSLLNYALIRTWVGDSADIICNGDDSVVCLPRDVFDSLDPTFFEDAGFKTKMQVVYDIHDVDYCQMKPCLISGRWRMVRDPTRFLSRVAYTCKTLQGAAWEDLAWSIGAGELSCNGGVPVLQEVASCIVRDNPNGKSDWLDRYMLENRRNDKIDVSCHAITDEARLSFWLCLGISVDQQLDMERFIRSQCWANLLS